MKRPNVDKKLNMASEDGGEREVFSPSAEVEGVTSDGSASKSDTGYGRPLLKRASVAVGAFALAVLKRFKMWFYGEKPNDTTTVDTSRYGRAFAAAVTVTVFLVFGLYYLGVYDIAFLDRPEEWKDNGTRFFEAMGLSEKEPAKPLIPDDGSGEDLDPSVDRIPSKDTALSDVPRRDNTGKISHTTVFKTYDELTGEGYYLTDATYSESTCEIGLMNYPFSLPDDFSYRNMKVRNWKVTTYDDGRDAVVTEVESSRVRPAIWLYMGYLFYDDDGSALYLSDRYGNILMNYDSAFVPAFARNRDGEPLFYNTDERYVNAGAAYETNELGEDVITQVKGVPVKEKKYYRLSGNGKYFVSDDYSEERDGRGLNFDFTADYGLSDTAIIRAGLMSPKVTTFLDGTFSVVNYMSWNYFLKNDPLIPDLASIAASREYFGTLSAEDKKAIIDSGETSDGGYGVDSLLPYSAAFNYNGGYAVAVTDNTGDDPKYEFEEVRVLNTYGEPMFASKKIYYNKDFKNYCSDRFLLPLSKGEESIGHLYFDHGLLRLRKVSYDNFQLDEFGDYRVNSDRDVLVYPNGEEFPIPNGYELKGYSDGVMVLEKDGKYGYMDYRGKWIAEPEYASASPFHGGIGVLETESGVCGAVNTDGGLVIPFKYSYIQSRSDSLIAAYSDSLGWQIYGVFTK